MDTNQHRTILSMLMNGGQHPEQKDAKAAAAAQPVSFNLQDLLAEYEAINTPPAYVALYAKFKQYLPELDTSNLEAAYQYANCLFFLSTHLTNNPAMAFEACDTVIKICQPKTQNETDLRFYEPLISAYAKKCELLLLRHDMPMQMKLISINSTANMAIAKIYKLRQSVPGARQNDENRICAAVFKAEIRNDIEQSLLLSGKKMPSNSPPDQLALLDLASLFFNIEDQLVTHRVALQGKSKHKDPAHITRQLQTIVDSFKKVNSRSHLFGIKFLRAQCLETFARFELAMHTKKWEGVIECADSLQAAGKEQKQFSAVAIGCYVAGIAQCDNGYLDADARRTLMRGVICYNDNHLNNKEAKHTEHSNLLNNRVIWPGVGSRSTLDTQVVTRLLEFESKAASKLPEKTRHKASQVTQAIAKEKADMASLPSKLFFIRALYNFQHSQHVFTAYQQTKKMPQDEKSAADKINKEKAFENACQIIFNDIELAIWIANHQQGYLQPVFPHLAKILEGDQQQFIEMRDKIRAWIKTLENPGQYNAASIIDAVNNSLSIEFFSIQRSGNTYDFMTDKPLEEVGKKLSENLIKESNEKKAAEKARAKEAKDQQKKEAEAKAEAARLKAIEQQVEKEKEEKAEAERLQAEENLRKKEAEDKAKQEKERKAQQRKMGKDARRAKRKDDEAREKADKEEADKRKAARLKAIQDEEDKQAREKAAEDARLLAEKIEAERLAREKAEKEEADKREAARLKVIQDEKDRIAREQTLALEHELAERKDTSVPIDIHPKLKKLIDDLEVMGIPALPFGGYIRDLLMQICKLVPCRLPYKIVDGGKIFDFDLAVFSALTDAHARELVSKYRAVNVRENLFCFSINDDIAKETYKVQITISRFNETNCCDPVGLFTLGLDTPANAVFYRQGRAFKPLKQVRQFFANQLKYTSVIRPIAATDQKADATVSAVIVREDPVKIPRLILRSILDQRILDPELVKAIVSHADRLNLPHMQEIYQKNTPFMVKKINGYLHEIFRLLSPQDVLVLIILKNLFPLVLEQLNAHDFKQTHRPKNPSLEQIYANFIIVEKYDDFVRMVSDKALALIANEKAFETESNKLTSKMVDDVNAVNATRINEIDEKFSPQLAEVQRKLTDLNNQYRQRYQKLNVECDELINNDESVTKQPNDHKKTCAIAGFKAERDFEQKELTTKYIAHKAQLNADADKIKKAREDETQAKEQKSKYDIRQIKSDCSQKQDALLSEKAKRAAEIEAKHEALFVEFVQKQVASNCYYQACFPDSTVCVRIIKENFSKFTRHPKPQSPAQVASPSQMQLQTLTMPSSSSLPVAAASETKGNNGPQLFNGRTQQTQGFVAIPAAPARAPTLVFNTVVDPKTRVTFFLPVDTKSQPHSMQTVNLPQPAVARQQRTDLPDAAPAVNGLSTVRR